MAEEHLGGERELRRLLREIHAAVIPMVDNVHKDVHGIRRDFRGAVEKSQTALLNRLSLIEAKIDKLGTGGLSPEDKAALADLVTEGERITRKVEALNAER